MIKARLEIHGMHDPTMSYGRGGDYLGPATDGGDQKVEPPITMEVISRDPQTLHDAIVRFMRKETGQETDDELRIDALKKEANDLGLKVGQEKESSGVLKNTLDQVRRQRNDAVDVVRELVAFCNEFQLTRADKSQLAKITAKIKTT